MTRKPISMPMTMMRSLRRRVSVSLVVRPDRLR